MGTILAHDAKQYSRWKGDVARRSARKSKGRDLAQLARDFGGSPDSGPIVKGGFEFRN